MWQEAVRNKLGALVLVGLCVVASSLRASCQSNSTHEDGSQITNKTDAHSTHADAKPSADQPAQTSKPSATEKPSKGKTHIHLGTVTVGASYTRFPAGFFAGPYWGYGFYPYDLFFYDPFYAWSFSEPSPIGFVDRPDKCEVLLEAKPGSASVYLNDAYAGTAGKLKHFWLAPGAYNLTVAAADGSEFHQRIYVLTGKSLKVRAKFAAPNE